MPTTKGGIERVKCGKLQIVFIFICFAMPLWGVSTELKKEKPLDVLHAILRNMAVTCTWFLLLEIICKQGSNYACMFSVMAYACVHAQ